MKTTKTIYPKTLEQLRKEFEFDLEFTQNQIELLKQIKRKRKKDGGDFKDFSKNFEGATIYKGSIYSSFYEIKGSIKALFGRTPVDYSVYGKNLSPDEIMVEIEKELEKLRERERKEKKVLDGLEEAYDFTIEKIIEIEEKMESELGDEGKYFLRRLLQNC